MEHHIDDIDGIKDIFIEMSKGIIFNEDTSLVTNKYKILLKEMDEAYYCIRSLNVNDNVINKSKNRIKIL